LRLIRFGLSTGFSLREMGVLLSNFGSRRARRRAAQGKIRELQAAQQRISLMERMLEQIKLCQCGTLREAAERVMGL
jgi:DNA-binding transcriptional MerR regulator